MKFHILSLFLFSVVAFHLAHTYGVQNEFLLLEAEVEPGQHLHICVYIKHFNT